jgi:hypothetical protein
MSPQDLKTRFESQLSRMNRQTSSCGSSSGRLCLGVRAIDRRIYLRSTTAAQVETMKLSAFLVVIRPAGGAAAAVTIAFPPPPAAGFDGGEAQRCRRRQREIA